MDAETEGEETIVILNIMRQLSPSQKVLTNHTAEIVALRYNGFLKPFSNESKPICQFFFTFPHFHSEMLHSPTALYGETPREASLPAFNQPM